MKFSDLLLELTVIPFKTSAFVSTVFEYFSPVSGRVLWALHRATEVLLSRVHQLLLLSSFLVTHILLMILICGWPDFKTTNWPKLRSTDTPLPMMSVSLTSPSSPSCLSF